MVTDTDLDQAIPLVLDEYQRQYRKPVPELRTGTFNELDSLRTARLVGVLIKRDFCNEVKLDDQSYLTHAWFAYNLKSEEIKVNGEQHQAFMDSWQAQMYSIIDPYNGPVQAATYIESEGDTARRL